MLTNLSSTSVFIIVLSLCFAMIILWPKIGRKTKNGSPMEKPNNNDVEKAIDDFCKGR